MTTVWKIIGVIVAIGILGAVIWLGLILRTTPTTYLVTYLTPDEIATTKEFIRIDVGRHKNYPLDLPLLVPSSGSEFDLPIEEMKKAEFETLPNKVVASWPRQFESRKRVPKIIVRIEYKDGTSETYLTYATYWAYLYDRKGNKIALHLCRMKDIQPIKKDGKGNRGAN